MSAGNSGPDVLISLVAMALGQARVTLTDLRGTVIPALSPARRTFPDHLARRLERGDIFDEALLRDLEAFTELVDRKVAEGTHVGWEADDHHVRGGYDVICLDDGIAALASAVCGLEDLSQAINSALDAVHAARVAEELLDA